MSEFGKYDVYTVVGSIYCYKGTNILRNKLDIRDGDELRRLDADISLLKQKSLLTNPIMGRFTSNHLCRIHKYMFEDVYPFAGHFRREDIMKGQTRFLHHGQIADEMYKLLSNLKEKNYLRGLDYDTFVERSAYYFAELNYIHPFREGNGRSLREFMRLLFELNGYRVDWAAVSAEKLLQAMEDSVYDTSNLQKVFRVCLLVEDK